MEIVDRVLCLRAFSLFAFLFSSTLFFFVARRSVGRSLVCEFLCTFGDSSGGRAGGDVQEHSHHVRLGGVREGGLGQNDQGQAVGDSSGMCSMDGPVAQRVGDRSAFAEPVSKGDLLFCIELGDSNRVGVPALHRTVAEFLCEPPAVGFGEHGHSHGSQVFLGGVDVRESGHDLLIGERVCGGEVPQLRHATQATTHYRQEVAGAEASDTPRLNPHSVASCSSIHVVLPLRKFSGLRNSSADKKPAGLQRAIHR